MMINRTHYFLLWLCAMLLIAFAIITRHSLLLHTAIAAGIFAFLRFFFLKLHVLALGFWAFCASVSVTLLAAFGNLFFIMTKKLDGLYYINDALSYLATRYYFQESHIRIYILTLLCISCLEAALRPERSLKKLIQPVLLSAVLFVVSAALFNHSVQTVYYDFTSRKLSPGTEIILAHLSDTHSSAYKNNELIQKIIAESPDLILMTGDIADDAAPFDRTAALIKGMQAIAPMYYVTGNHEYASRQFQEYNDWLRAHGVHDLDDGYAIASVKGQDILIAGVNDPLSRYVEKDYITIQDRLAILQQQTKDFPGLQLLLSHRPELFDTYANFSYDFVLSGHAHGGQVRIPFLLNGLIAPNQGFFPSHAGGVYDLSNPSHTKLIVSRGLSISALPRILNPPELVIIRVRGAA